MTRMARMDVALKLCAALAALSGAVFAGTPVLPADLGTPVGPPTIAQVAAAGWYVRGDIGGQMLAQDRGYWWGPGGPPSDPRITFSLDRPMGVTGDVGIGYDWMNGFRSDLTFTLNGSMDVTASFLSASDGSPSTGHVQSITTSVSSQVMLANLYFEPLKATGNDNPIQPFLTGGIGAANVSMGEWTRYNPSDSRVYRTFEGASQLNLAWSVGAGVSFALSDVIGGHPAMLDVTHRFSNLGNVAGSSTPLPGNGNGDPYEPLNFDYTAHAVTLGLRIPIGG